MSSNYSKASMDAAARDKEYSRHKRDAEERFNNTPQGQNNARYYAEQQKNMEKERENELQRINTGGYKKRSNKKRSNKKRSNKKRSNKKRSNKKK